MFRKILSGFLAATIVALAPLTLYPALAEAPAVQSAAPDWAFEDSDLPVDPAFRFGELANGMRYVIRRNATPAGQAEVRLYIDSGSFSETEEEQGYAHFVEHMAFNGSTNVPEGEMVKLLEREGLAFGADTNASTNFDYTYYRLDLPRNDPKLLDTALFLLRETASELTFNQEAVDREKGVVLSEKRVRDTFSYRNLVDNLDFLYPGSNLVERLPIGTEETLNAATKEKLEALWRRLYTPANATVFVVGDFDPDLVEAAIKARFADWAAAPAPPPGDAGRVDPALTGLVDIQVDPALPEQISVSRNGPFVDEPDSVAKRQENLLRQVGYGIVNRRLQRLATGDDPPFRGAAFDTADVFESGRTTALTIDTGEGEWQRGLAAATAEYRRALAFGFTAAEVAEQLANLRTSLENSVAGAETFYNRTHTDSVFALVHDEQVPTTPQTTLERFEAFAPAITPEAVLAALQRGALPLDGDALLRLQGRAAPEGGEAAIRAAWAVALAAPVEQAAGQELASFGYTDFGPPGTVVSDIVSPELGIREIRFANGVRLNLKRTDLKRDRIGFELNLDGGQMLATKDQPLAVAMTSALPLGGLGKHSFDELQSILAGRTVSFNISPSTDTFRIASTTTPKDLELQLQLAAAALTDPGFRTQGEEQFRRTMAAFFASRDATPESALGNALGGIVSDNDPRFTLQSREAYDSLGFDKLRAAIADRLAHGAIELALVGDFDEQAAIELVARTLGALPPREPEFLPYDANRQRGFTADRSQRTVFHGGSAGQAALRIAWPTRDYYDQRENIQLELLQGVVQVELIAVLRERLGKTYSPQVGAAQSREYPGYGIFTVGASVEPGEIPATHEALLGAITALRDAPVDADVLLRARKPMLEAYDNALKTNEGWMRYVARAQSQPDRIARFVTGRAVLESLTPAEVQAIAQRYLDPAQGLKVVALPRPAAPAGEE